MKVLLGILVILASTTLGTREVLALSCMYTPFEQQVEWAKLIFVGTVASDTCVWVPCDPGGTDTCTIVTKYRFDRVTYLKGQGPVDSLIIVQEGGIIGNDGIMASGEVEFEVRSKYVVLARHSRVFDSYSASPCGLGPFGVWPDSSSAAAVVHLGRNPLVAFDGTHLVGLHSKQWTPDLGVWERDASGVRRPPSQRPLPELIQAFDADLRSRMEREGSTKEQIEEVTGRVRRISLFPHQDPGVRVTEEEFLTGLSSVIKRVEETTKGK